MINLTIKPNKPIILLDSGYILCQRYFATTRYLSFQDDNKDINVEAAFRKHLTDKFNKYKQKLKGDLFLCKDMSTSSVWRTALYPEYKGLRQESIDLKPFMKIMYDVCRQMNIYIIELPRAEADDIIALSVKALRSITGNQIVIITSDRDFIQLTKSENVFIKDANMKPMNYGDPYIELWVKILMGDKSDNIPPVFPKCGKKTALALAMDEQKRDEMIKKKDCHSQLAKNFALISMEAIPEEFSIAYHEKYKWIIL